MIQLDENFDFEAVRERLRRMDDAALLKWGQAAARLSSQREIFRVHASDWPRRRRRTWRIDPSRCSLRVCPHRHRTWRVSDVGAP
jgi:hypothetical protein